MIISREYVNVNMQFQYADRRPDRSAYVATSTRIRGMAPRSAHQFLLFDGALTMFLLPFKWSYETRGYNTLDHNLKSM